MRPRPFLLACLALACGRHDDREADGDVVCDEQLAPLKVYACAHRKEQATKPPYSVEITGTVLATGSIDEFSNCAHSFADAGGFWLEMDDSNGQRWVLGAMLPNPMLPSGNPLGVGATVSAMASRAHGYPTTASLTLRDANGKLIAYVGEAGEAAELEPPDGILVTRGQAICSANDGCGDWKAYDLGLEVADTTAKLPYGKITSVGPYRFAHGGAELQAGDPASPGGLCSGVSLARVAIGITPLQ